MQRAAERGEKENELKKSICITVDLGIRPRQRSLSKYSVGHFTVTHIEQTMETEGHGLREEQ